MPPIPRRVALAGLTLSLLPAGLRAQGRDATPAGFNGRVFVQEGGGTRLHTYMAAPAGALVTSHIIETGAGLVLVDGQLTVASAQELKRYIDSLGGRLARVMVSHQHADHWFGLHHLGRPAVHAGPVTAAYLRDTAANVVAERKVDSSAPVVEGVLAEGETSIGGVAMRIRFVLNTEAPEIATIELPALGAVIVQDVVYNRVHAVVNKQLDTWIATVRGLERSTATLLSGHGEPATAADLPRLVAYLEAVKPLIAANTGGDAKPVMDEMARAFPEFRVPSLLALGLSRALKA